MAIALFLLGVEPPGTATLPIRYRLAAAGNVSLAVYDARGALVRELLRATPQPPGDHAVEWDGRDRSGKPASPGTYGWKLLETRGLQAEYLLSVGSNYPVGTSLSSSGGPGTHLSPFAAASDGTGVYVGALSTENIESGLIKLSPDGKSRLWSQKLPTDEIGIPIAWEGARSLASDGNEIYLLGHLQPQRVHVSDAQSGMSHRAFRVDWAPPLPDHLGRDATGGATDMALAPGVVVVAYTAHDAISWFDSQTGAHLAAAHVEGPVGVAADRAGTVFVTTGDRLVRLTRARPRPVTLRTQLTKPGPIAVDPTSGDLLVFEGGAHQQVVRFSARGELLHRYGTAGGRRDGLYVPTDFRDVTALAADGRGGFFAAEPFAAPRRVTHVDRVGSVVQEWYGGQPWDTGAAFEPGRPEAMWVASAAMLDGAHTVMRVLIDYTARSWRVHSCYRMTGPENPLMHGSGNEGSLFHVYRHAGTNYLVTEGEPSIWRIDEERWRLLPVTAVGNGVQWNDADGDGLPRATEKTPFAARLGRTFAVPHLAEDFDFFFVSIGEKPCRIRRLAVTSWNSVGAPIYGGDPDGEVYADCPARFSQAPLDPRWAVFLHFDGETGNLFAAINPGTTGWCTSRDSFAQAWNAAGRLTWQAGELGPARTLSQPNGLGYVTTAPGLIYWNLRGIAGVTHGSLVAIDVDGGWANERAQTYVWDRDGLFVGGIFDHPKLEGIPEFMYHLGGEFAHAALYTLPDGAVLFAGNWENEIRLYRITGWDGPDAFWVRMSGQLTLAPPAAPGIASRTSAATAPPQCAAGGRVCGLQSP